MESITSKVRSVLEQAQILAKGLGHQHFVPLHVLQVFLKDGHGLFASLIAHEQVDASSLLSSVDRELGRLPRVEGGGDALHMSSELARVFFDVGKNSQGKG